MSRSAKVTLGWAEGEYDFRLAWAQLMALQEACDAGPAHVLERLSRGTWRLQDVEQPILQGLLGAGMEAAEARRLVKTYVKDQPLSENIMVAMAVLSAAILGVEDEPVEEFAGKPAAATETS